jgi:hypothetical protein
MEHMSLRARFVNEVKSTRISTAGARLGALATAYTAHGGSRRKAEEALQDLYERRANGFAFHLWRLYMRMQVWLRQGSSGLARAHSR